MTNTRTALRDDCAGTCRIRSLVPASASALALALMLALTPGPADAGERLLTGQLTGASDHVTTGTVSIERDGDATYVVLGSDFSLDGAPAPTLAFGKDGEFVAETEFTRLNAKTGAQRYRLPAGFSLTNLNTFFVWCSKFSVPLGKARLG